MKKLLLETLHNSGTMKKRMIKAPIKAKNESNSPLFANFLTMSGVFSNFFIRSTGCAKVSISLYLLCQFSSVDAFNCGGNIDVPVIECEALNAAYISFGIANSTLSDSIKMAWGDATEINICEAHDDNGYGVLCEDGTTVTKLILNNSNLTGDIPSSISNLLNLEQLYLFNNELTGSIPNSIGNLAQLKTFSVYNNNLMGSIPSSIGNLSNLQTLSMYGNNFSGTIPPSIGDLSFLSILILSSNDLIGTIPDSFGNLSNIQILSLQNNNLTGTIPESLNNLTNLSSLSLFNNFLIGTFPDLTQTNIMVSTGETATLRIQSNCLSPYSGNNAQEINQWISERAFDPFGLNHQRPDMNTCLDVFIDFDGIFSNSFE